MVALRTVEDEKRKAKGLTVSDVNIKKVNITNDWFLLAFGWISWRPSCMGAFDDWRASPCVSGW
jgi:hypothetical protein